MFTWMNESVKHYHIVIHQFWISLIVLALLEVIFLHDFSYTYASTLTNHIWQSAFSN